MLHPNIRYKLNNYIVYDAKIMIFFGDYARFAEKLMYGLFVVNRKLEKI